MYLYCLNCPSSPGVEIDRELGRAPISLFGGLLSERVHFKLSNYTGDINAFIVPKAEYQINKEGISITFERGLNTGTVLVIGATYKSHWQRMSC